MIRRAKPIDRTDANGVVFDSAAEMRRWHELQAMEKIGAISDLRRQVTLGLFAARARHQIGITAEPIKIRSPRYKNGRDCSWTADFVYTEKDKTVYEEFKGVWTDVSRLRMAIAEACYGITVRVTGPAKMKTRRANFLNR